MDASIVQSPFVVSKTSDLIPLGTSRQNAAKYFGPSGSSVSYQSCGDIP